ncbi:MAG: ABC transporter permease [Planctomycetales bacterium]|nr:ABC transporter permease [Planctomycetales bacterium]
MYKLLLSSRYLRSRYIALASIISVTLGVATMIIVNSVMSGFQEEMYKRLHGILSDIVVEARSTDGIQDPDLLMARIQETLGDDVAAMTPNVHIPAMLSFKVRDEWVPKQVNLIGVDQETYAHVSDFGKYLLHPANRDSLSFELREGGYDDRLGVAGWMHRRNRVALERAYAAQQAAWDRAQQPTPSSTPANSPAALSTVMDPAQTPMVSEPDPGQQFASDTVTTSDQVTSQIADPFAGYQAAEQPEVFDPMVSQRTGIVMGIAISSLKHRNEAGEVVDYFLCRPGDDVMVTFPTAGTPPKIAYDTFTVVDLYESKMSEYDAGFAFVPIERIQQLRGMIDPSSGVGAVTAVQIRLAEGVVLEEASARLQAALDPRDVPYSVQTWKEMQGPLLAAVEMETTILNILLFLIIAVAGFGILATFFMIVVEKTRDIGILKSLGASHRGVMSIFLSYGLALGVAGAVVGMVLGLVFVTYINQIAGVLEKIQGRELFDPTVYYFQEIPTIINPLTVSWIVLGAILIAVIASVLPAIRAARLHPVEALRYE